MLCLTLKADEKLIVLAGGERIEIVNRDKVRHKVGIEAPRSVKVLRDGVAEKEQQQ